MDVDSEANPKQGHEVVPAECLSELKKEQATSAFLSSDVVEGNVSNIIKIQRFSDVEKLFRVTGCVVVHTEFEKPHKSAITDVHHYRMDREG